MTSSVRHDGASWLQTARNNDIKQPFQPSVPIQRNPLVTQKLNEPKQQLAIPNKPQLPLSTKQQQHNQLVYMPVTKSSSQQVIPDKITQKKLISSNQHVVARPKMHNQGRRNVPKQLASTKPGRINEKVYKSYI